VHCLTPILVTATASFIAVSSHHLEESDTWCILYPYIRPLLKADVPNLEAATLLDVVSEPVSSAYFKPCGLL
jgi:phosphoinositide-3-kinase regulatory subunit 4